MPFQIIDYHKRFPETALVPIILRLLLHCNMAPEALIWKKLLESALILIAKSLYSMLSFMRDKNKRRRRNNRIILPSLREILLFNTYSALRNESYSLIMKLVDETLKDPVLRKKIDRLAREFIKGIAERLYKPLVSNLS